MDVTPSLERLGQYIESADYAGYDPYDALNSPVLSALSFRQKHLRIGWMQFMRRFPLNIRPLLMIKKGHNPKALGLFLWGYSKLSKIHGYDIYRPQVRRLLDLLDKCRSDCTGHGWGYNFDWQSRAFWVPKYTPTIVNSSFIGHALLDTWEITGEQRALDMAVPIKDFILNDLERTKDKKSFCFSYTPVDQLVVHNANLLGASLLIRLYNETGDNSLRELALQSLDWSMNRQHQNGSWPFGDTDYQQWIDSFHTGFNLQAIRYFLQCGEAQQYQHAYHKGVSYYAGHFFLPDGTPKYYHNRTYPIDIHSPAQAVVFFSGEGEVYSDLTDCILRWMLENFYDARGFFYFRKGRFMTNRIPYMRWSQAWGFHALTEYYIHNCE